jgi:hypothetical protein
VRAGIQYAPPRLGKRQAGMDGRSASTTEDVDDCSLSSAALVDEVSYWMAGSYLIPWHPPDHLCWVGSRRAGARHGERIGLGQRLPVARLRWNAAA